MKRTNVISALVAAQLSGIGDFFKRATVPNPFHTATRSHGAKHEASKRGHKHKHGMSKGQRKDAAKL